MATTAISSPFSARVNRIEVSATIAMTAEAAKLRAKGNRPMRPGQGRAALKHAAAHQGCRDRRYPAEFHEVHRRRRRAGAAQSHREAPCGRLWFGLHG